MREITWASPQLTKLLGKVFDFWRSDLRTSLDRATYKKLRFDFVFHMTDWLNDLKVINKLYGEPETYTGAQASKELFGILIHILPHLNASSRLLLGEVSDPFAGLYREPEMNKSAATAPVDSKNRAS